MTGRPIVYVFALDSSFNCGASRRYNISAWGFFSLAGAEYWCRTRLRGRSCWIAQAAPPGWIEARQGRHRPIAHSKLDPVYGKVYRRRKKAA